MKSQRILIGVGITMALAILACRAAIPSQDNKYTLKIPNGLSFAAFEGYERWQTIAVSHNGDKLAVILGDPAEIRGWRRMGIRRV